MPTYEFRCPSGHDFERFFRTISGSPSELPCPECGRIALRRVSGGAGLLFKGSGFYITDYGKDGKKGTTAAEKAGGESGGGDAAASKPETGSGTEAKPAAAKETAKSEPAPAKKPKPSTE